TDPDYVNVATRIGRAAQRLSPIGAQGLITATQQGEPLAPSLVSLATGMRVSHDSDTANRQRMVDEINRQVQITPDVYQPMQTTYYQHNASISQDVSDLAGRGELTPAEREKQIGAKLGERFRRPQWEEDNLPPDVLADPELKKQYLDE